MVEGVENVSEASSRSGEVGADRSELNGKQSLSVRNVSYSLIVIETLSKIGMSPVEQNIGDQADLEQTINKLQGSLTNISMFLSKLENNAKSSDVVNIAAICDHGSNFGILDKYAFNGLDGNFLASKDFDNSVHGFVSQIKSIFFANTDKSNLTLGSMMTIHTPDGKTIDLTSYWGQVAKEFNGAFANDQSNPLGNNKIILDPSNSSMSDTGSLLQVYIYQKLQVKMDETSISKLKKDNYDPFKVLDPNPKGGSGGDGIATELMNFLSSLDTTVTVSRNSWNPGGNVRNTGAGNHHWDHNAGLPTDNVTSGNVLALIVNNQYDDINPGASYTYGTVPGLDTTIGYMAFNYFWTKNPNAKGGQEMTPKQGIPQGSYFIHGLGDGWINSSSMPGAAQGDLLSDLYSSTTGLQTLAGNDSQSGSTQLQEQTQEMSQYQNIGQNIVKNATSEKNTMVSSFKAG
ncbi:MAG: hypothetical protein S4CHLAM37_11860 [Chlamydiia bacterium]|nr:hypothetical protein [Chlamydiia bacterium]